MNALEMELATNLSKVRKEYEFVKFGESSYASAKMDFQRIPRIDDILVYVRGDVEIKSGTPFLWKGRGATLCPELLFLKPKWSKEVYVLAPIDDEPDILVEAELEFAMSLVSKREFPFKIADRKFTKDQMAFARIPELDEMLLCHPDWKELDFDGRPINVRIEYDRRPTMKMIVLRSQHDGNLYILAPIVD